MATPVADGTAPPVIELPRGFEIHGVTSKLTSGELPTSEPPPLVSLSEFQGAFTGPGFNNIFRPRSSKTPPEFNKTPQGPDDNVLELNLVTDTITFAKDVGSVPNRGLNKQGDIFLSGMPYMQTTNDVTNLDTGKADATPTAIHFENGLWMRVPKSDTNPVQAETVNRMGSIPHGTTINAQGFAPTGSKPGGPNIPKVDITPFPVGKPSQPLKNVFPSQKLDRDDTFRIPQDLGLFKKSGTITQDILDDPNTVLRNANKGKKINHTTTIEISTNPRAPQLGGGTANIDFLLGGKSGEETGPNAHAVDMTATFWVSEVSHEITVPKHAARQGALNIQAPSPSPGIPAPVFIVNPPVAIPQPRKITVTSTQIQYSQNVLLDFFGLSWPHVSVATLIPAAPIEIDNAKAFA